MRPRGLGRGLSALLPDADKDVEPTGLLEVPLRDIKPNPHQPRREFNPGDLEELASSIRAKGVIQPLLVSRSGTGYQLIAGERRLRAAEQAGIRTVPVRVIEIGSEVDMLELSLIENLQRNDLNPVELAEGYRKLQQNWGLTQELIARRVGKERATVANTLRLLELPEPILDSVRKGEISMGHAKTILSVEGTARRSALWKKIIDESLSVRQAEAMARASAGVKKKTRRKIQAELPPEIQEYTDRLRRALGTQINIQKKGKKGYIKVEFYSDEDLVRLVELLEERKSWY